MVTGERIQGNPPLLDNAELASYSTGLYNEEGYSYCKKRTGRRAGGPSRTIAIAMCDKDALEPAARWWGLPVRPRGGRVIVCPDGPAYRIEASGLRAELIVHEMAKFGLSRRKLEQWHGVLAKCETERTRSMIPRAALIHLSHGTRLFEEVDRKGEAGKRPWWNDTILARYSTGLFNGGGCSWYSARRACPIITVAMCDKDALEPVGKWWGVRVTPRHGKAKVCAAGPAYQIRTQGLRARTVVGEMMQIGLSKRKIEQWRKALSQRERAGRTVPR